MSYILAAISIFVLCLIWFVAGLAKKSARARMLEEELDEWEGVMDVKRETRDKLKSNPDYVKRVQDKFND